MKLPSTFPGLKRLRLLPLSLKIAILERREAIRRHRDQKGDDRCWLDDEWLSPFVHGSIRPLRKLPPFGRMMQLCTDFYEKCRGDMPDPIPETAIRTKRLWDKDLESMNYEQLLFELYRLQLALATIDDIRRKRPLTADDLRTLYRVLPENLPADFRLPARKDFLGEGKSPCAGCPSFWRSHENCKGSCDLHRWGPCYT